MIEQSWNLRYAGKQRVADDDNDQITAGLSIKLLLHTGPVRSASVYSHPHEK